MQTFEEYINEVVEFSVVDIRVKKTLVNCSSI